MEYSNFINQTINNLKIISIEKDKFKCICLKCNNIYYRSKYDFNRKIKPYSCGCTKSVNKELVHNWTGFNELTGHQFSRWRTGAKRRNLDFNITPEIIWNIYIKQNKTCPITKEYLYFYNNSNEKTNLSIDRINNNIGYIESNILLTHIDFNKFHHIYDFDTLYYYSNLIQNPLNIGFNQIKNIYSWIWISIKRNCDIRNISNFTITKDILIEQFNKQNGCCFYTGIPLNMVQKAKDRKILHTASLDRIDSSQGYLQDNIVWCHKDINMMKKDLSYDRFIYLANSFAKNQYQLQQC